MMRAELRSSDKIFGCCPNSPAQHASTAIENIALTALGIGLCVARRRGLRGARGCEAYVITGL